MTSASPAGPLCIGMGLTRTFLEKQDATAKVRSEFFSVIFWWFIKSLADSKSMRCMEIAKSTTI